MKASGYKMKKKDNDNWEWDFNYDRKEETLFFNGGGGEYISVITKHPGNGFEPLMDNNLDILQI